MTNNKIKIAFFVKQGLDSFIDNIITHVSKIYDTKKVIVTNLTQIDSEMRWADTCWFEWCDELVSYASRLDIAFERKIICRLHSYEAFTDYPSEVNWDAVDKVIFVAEHIRDYVVDKCSIDKSKTVVIPNGIDVDNYTFRIRKHGFNIAYAGFINYKKGPMLLLHTFKAIYDKDNRYKLYIAGTFQDERDILYFKQMITKWNLEGSIIYQGWQENLNEWFEDKNYVLCTSILESQNISVMQAMAKGIKPIVHNFVGAKYIYTADSIFNTIDEAINLLEGEYHSDKYREFVEDKYCISKTMKMISVVLMDVHVMSTKQPLVSIIMPVYNREKYLEKAMASVLNQSYRNIELIVVNDGSTDDSERIIKSFKDTRIRYFYKVNSGQLLTIKYGLERVTGKFATRIDSDDMVDKDYIKTCLMEMIRDNTLKFVYTDFLLIDNEDSVFHEISFKDFSNPIELITEVFTGFASVIPDTSFWRQDYIKNVIVNYTEQNVPFYIDNIMISKYKHIKRSLYLYRKHESNFTAISDNLKISLEGKIKFIDLLIRRYFIQMNVTGGFSQNKQEYLASFSSYFSDLAQRYVNQGQEIVEMFKKESDYWNQANQGHQTTKNRRILIVSTDDPMDGKAVGGKHTHIHLLQQGLKELNIPSLLISYIHSDIMEVSNQLLKKGFDMHSLADNLPEMLASRDNVFLYLVYAIQTQLEHKIEKAINENYYSHISCQDVIGAYASYKVIKKLNVNIPIITTLHGYFTYENVDYGLLYNQTPIYNFFLEYEKKAYEVSDRLIAVDSRIKAYVVNMLAATEGEIIGNIKGEEDIAIQDIDIRLSSNNKIDELKNSVNDINFCPNSDTQKVFGSNIILVPRRLVPKNGVINTVKAAKDLIDRGVTNFSMIIAGDGIERNRIEEYIKKYQLNSHVHLWGSIPHDQIESIYKLAKIVIIPSIPSNNVEEATSISLLEGMSCGKVVIASKIGGLKEVLKNGENGFLIPPNKPKAIANILEQILNMSYEDYSKIANQARQDITSGYGYRDHTSRYLDLFDKG